MANGIYSALAGAATQAQALDVMANNLANLETTGFKGSRAIFKEVLIKADGVLNQTARQVVVDEVQTDFSHGGVLVTNRPLDLAIAGDGFFEIETAEGVRYTRSGSFQVDAERNLTTADGGLVMGDGGPLQAPPERTLQVNERGMLMADDLEIGTLKVVEFENRDNLIQAGHSLWEAPEELDQEVEVSQDHFGCT